ncbi:MAG: hypothetical protein QNK37_22110 [Acidobacteriota bacterium]|nr:hypothetical protein [Acidobacteriota bacterium]
MGLFFLLLFGQVTYQEEAPVKLNLPPIPFERITITSNYILIADENDLVVHVFKKDGTHLARLGEKGDVFQLPSRISWLDKHRMIMVYDGAGRYFSFWNEQGKMIGRKDTKFDLFFQVGDLLLVEGGYVAPISLAEGKYLMARFDRDFKIQNYGYQVIDARLTDMSPVVRQAFSAQVKVNGQINIICGQSLSNSVSILDENLNNIGEMVVADDRWRKVNYKRLAKVSKNPKELRKLQDSFSEVVAVEAVSASIFVVGFRNLKGSDYTYQAFEAKSRSPIGNPYDTTMKVVGATSGTLYFKDPNQKVMTLVPCRVQR